MPGSELEAYRKYVKKNLGTITEMLARISADDFTHRVDFSKLPEDDFLNVFCGLDLLMDDLLDVRMELKRQSDINEIRAEIWKLALDKSLKTDEFVNRLFGHIGPGIDLLRASHFVFRLEENVAFCENQWCKPGVRPTTGLTIDLEICRHYLSDELAILDASSIQGMFESQIKELFQKTGISSFFAIPFPTASDAQGFFSFSSGESGRVWSDQERQILKELVNIYSVRSGLLEAEESLRRTNERLERRVRKRTEDLISANEKLRNDIIERQRAEEALSESEEKYRTLVETSPDAIVVSDPEGNIRVVNNRAREMFGCDSSEELVGRSIFDMVVPEDREKAVESSRRTEKDGFVKGVELRLQRKDGVVLHSEVSSSVFRDSQGSVRYIAIARDITSRRRAEKELEEEKELLDVTLRSIGDAVVSTDMDGNVVLMNAVAETLTGWKQAEAVGKLVDDVVCMLDEGSGNQCVSLVEEIRQSGAVVSPLGERTLRARSGVDRTISCSGAPIRDVSGNLVGVVLVIRDITEQKKFESELFKTAKLESLGLLAGGIAHDFNNILTGIVTNLFMAKMNVKENDELRQLITDAEKAAFRASRLTKQLLTFSKGGTPVKENLAVRSLVEDSVGFCLSGSNVDYKLDLPEDLWGIEADRGQVDQVLNNLVINADQAMPSGGTITVKAENQTISNAIQENTTSIVPLKPGKYVKITVRDEGIGIPPSNLEKIFDPYFSTKQEGSGLGLTTAFSIVKNHGGYMTAQSILGRGSRFSFYLPAVATDAEEDDGAEEQLRRGAYRVLVMDDDEIVRAVVERLLRSNGYEVVVTRDGQAAIDAYQDAVDHAELFDIVIMDLTVPGGLGGKDAVKQILKIDPEARVVVFSGYSNDPVMSNYRDYGFSGVIAKPFSIDEFSRVLNRIMIG